MSRLDLYYVGERVVVTAGTDRPRLSIISRELSSHYLRSLL